MRQGRIEMTRLIVFAAITFISTACSGKEVACTVPLIESVQSLTTQQIGELAAQQVQSSGQHSAVLWSFDEEDRPRQGSKVAIGFLLVSTGDIGAQPVGALIWTENFTHATLKAGAPNEFVVEFVNRNQNCTSASVVVRVQSDGAVIAGEQGLGHLK